LVKDINTNGSSNPAWFLPFGDRLYFSANDGIKGMELWRTDGTPNGTKRVKDIRVGSNGSSPSELTRVGTRFFFATDVGGGQLWKSDGTASGTVLVEALGDPFGALTKVGSNLFFAGPPGFPPGLWKSNGTAAGTMQIDDTTCGFEGCHLTNVGGIAYVSAFSDDGLELVRSNGTVAGTYVVKDINPGEDSDSWPEGLINVSGKLMFYATTDAAGQELWKSNGTEAGTKRVAAISPILTPGSPMAAMGGIWYGEATHNVTHEDGLWSSNGTEPGTELIMEFVGVGELTPVNGVLYFWAHDGVSNHGRELWKYVP
jgi:ELWxxDGT repeat protein